MPPLADSRRHPVPARAIFAVAVASVLATSAFGQPGPAVQDGGPGVVTAVRQTPTEAGRASAKEGMPDATTARAYFDRLAALAGEWRAVSSQGWSGTIRYEVLARGSVVMGTTEFSDDPASKMATMFTMDGDRLVATHYCEAGNQPRLVAEEIDLEAGRAVFRFAGGGNMEDRDEGHMDQAVFHLGDDRRFRSRWTWYADGSERWLEEIELERSR